MNKYLFLIVVALLVGCHKSTHDVSMVDLYKKDYINNLYLKERPTIYINSKNGRIGLNMADVKYPTQFKNNNHKNVDAGYNQYNSENGMMLYLFLLNKIYSENLYKKDFFKCSKKGLPIISIKDLTVGENHVVIKGICNEVKYEKDKEIVFMTEEEIALYNIMLEKIEIDFEGKKN